MDLMPIFTAQPPSFRQSVQDANARTIARHQQAAVFEHRLQPCSMRTIRQSSDSISKECRTNSGTHFPFGDNLIAQFFIIQSELSDQQRESLTSAMSLRNISLENYSYEMLKTHYHELFITTRTSIQDPSIRPQGGNRSNTFFIIEQGEYEGEEGFWVEDEEGLEGFMSNNDEETLWVREENDAFIARKVSGRNFKFKKRKGKGKSGNKKGHIGEKARERRERKENRNSNIPMMETKVIHPVTGERKIQDVRSHRRKDGGAARHPADCTIHRAYLCRLDRPRLGSIMDME